MNITVLNVPLPLHLAKKSRQSITITVIAIAMLPLFALPRNLILNPSATAASDSPHSGGRALLFYFWGLFSIVLSRTYFLQSSCALILFGTVFPPFKSVF
jgi:hypothetical protein